jgi:hypothetical protein
METLASQNAIYLNQKCILGGPGACSERWHWQLLLLGHRPMLPLLVSSNKVQLGPAS